MEKPRYYVIYKDFNNGEVKYYDIIEPLLSEIIGEDGKLVSSGRLDFLKGIKSNPEDVKSALMVFVRSELMSRYWARCEWEFIAIDWPNRDTIEGSRPVKVDVFRQIEPNLPLINDIVWNYLVSVL